MPSREIDQFWKKMQEKRFLIGTHITGWEPLITEMIGQLDFDYLWVDTEHTYLDKKEVLEILIALRGCGFPIFCRTPWNDPVRVKPLLDIGVDGIIFPMIRTSDDARRAVASCCYPPEGIRGFGPYRAARCGLDSPLDYVQHGSKKIVKLLQIETREAVDNLEEIARVPGVDLFVLGPMDLSGAYGKLAQDKDPEIRRIYQEVITRARRAGKEVLVSMGDDSCEGIADWVQMGIKLVTTGNPYTYVLRGMKNLLKNADTVLRETERK